jgi:predicted cupin superfamily sugar epimerase
MIKHPEGGYYVSTYSSPLQISDKELEKTFTGTRPLATSIYFLIHDDDVSNFHRLQADEMWYFHDGDPLVISEITPDGKYIEHKLGLDILKGEKPQVLVPAGSIFGSFVLGNKGFSLVGCMVSYGFEFEDFELFNRESLLKNYPQHEKIIKKLTRI